MGTWTGTDQEAEVIFKEIYETEYEKLVRCAIIYLKKGNNEAHVLSRAEDVVQEMFALAWKRRSEVLSSEKPVGWLYNALQYEAKTFLKQENKWVKQLLRYEQFYIEPPEPCVSLGFELRDLLSKEDYNLLYRFYVAGYSYRELCEETGLTKSALGVRIHRIKQKVQQKAKK